MRILRTACRLGLFLAPLTGSVVFAHAQAAPGAPALGSSMGGAATGQTPGGSNAPAGAARNNTNGARTATRTAAEQRAQDKAPDEDQQRIPPASPDRTTEFQQMVARSTGKDLPIFGSSLFQGVPSTFAPVDNVPVTPDYEIGPGDELNIETWGQLSLHDSYTVDRSGNIFLPEVGSIHVAGIPFSDLHGYLRSQMNKVYRNFDFNVNLGQLRSIQVFVVGQARRPGVYTISSLSTMVNALFASGGPLPTGSLRHIQLRRNGKADAEFDLYDLLLHGDKTKDVHLLPGDVIYIPPAGSQVAVAGSVVNPAIYELRSESTLGDVLQLAGGLSNVAANAQVRVERIYQHTLRTVADVELNASGLQTKAGDGDIIEVTSIIDRFSDAVTLRGNVANPGRYVWHPGMRLHDILPNRDVFITRDYWQKRNELGRTSLDYENGGQSTTEGALQIRGATTQSGDASAASTGPQAVSSTGVGNSSTPAKSSISEALTESSSTFSAKNDVVLSAPDVNWNYAVIDRQDPKDLSTTLVSFNLGKLVLENDESQNLELFPNDVITIFSKADIRVPTVQQTRFVRLEGEFISSGVYSVHPGETLRQLVRRAGGFTPDAYLYGSDFTRESTRRLQQQRLNEYADELESEANNTAATANVRAVSPDDVTASQAQVANTRTVVNRLRQTQSTGRIVLNLSVGSQGVDALPDLALEDGDRFVVPHIPSNVTVEGQVYSANAFLFIPGRRVENYLQMAGGPTRDADKKRAFVIRADGSVRSRQYDSNFNTLRLFPGDTLVVPHNTDRRAAIRTLLDLATIVGQFGIGVAAATYLIR